MAKGGTPAIEMLEAADVAFTVTEFHHEPGEGNFGQVAAAALGIEPERVFKTLVANLATETGIEQVVGIVPVSGQLSLRKLASALGGKRAEMCPVDLAQRLTGYVVGGISPFGQKNGYAPPSTRRACSSRPSSSVAANAASTSRSLPVIWSPSSTQ